MQPSLQLEVTICDLKFKICRFTTGSSERVANCDPFPWTQLEYFAWVRLSLLVGSHATDKIQLTKKNKKDYPVLNSQF